jgi:site-specific DNA-methyltransferase (adenine-specific)
MEPELKLIHKECLSHMKTMPDNSVDSAVYSPPYCGKDGRYGEEAKKWTVADWPSWQADVLQETARVSKGPVVCVATGRTRKGRYEPSCELLIAELYRRGVDLLHPLVWVKNSPPHGAKKWYSSAWEYLIAVVDADDYYFDWESVGSAPLYKTGGRFRQRDQSGKRRLGGEYPQNPICRPRDVIDEPTGGVFDVSVGGGHMAGGRVNDKLACKGPAPFPEKLVEFLIKACCPPGGIVFDPFVGSGTTLAVARRLGRSGIGIDIRESQIDLARRRLGFSETKGGAA